MDFCAPAGSPEMRSEVLREAAKRRFSYYMPDSPIRTRNSRITLTIQSWNGPVTFKVSNGSMSGEVAQILQVVGDSTTLAEVQQKSKGQLNQEKKRFHFIVANVNHNQGELDKLGLTFAGLQREKAYLQIFAGIHKNKNSFHLFTSEQKACKEWACKTLYIDSDKENWAALADIASTGHIDALVILSSWQLEEVKVENMWRVWEISQSVHLLRPFTSFGGGKGENSEAGWKCMMEHVQDRGRTIKQEKKLIK